MRKIAVCCIILLFFNSCFDFGGMSDWSIKLINDYEIWRSSSDNIIIGFVKDNGISYKGGVTEGELAIIPAKIIKFSIYNQYICAVVDPYIFGKIDHTEDYYILNTIEQKITVAMSDDEYNIQIEKLEIIIEEWVETKNINPEWLKKNGYIRVGNELYNKWEKL
jgi:hypothetical protein